jgi:alkyl hydroperoxide reductase subunit AhpC
MAKKKTTLQHAAEMLIESSSIILQKKVKDKVMVLKFHKLDFPNVRYTSASNGEVERDTVLDINTALTLLATALEYI